MGASRPPGTRKALLGLASFAVAFGAVAWLATEFSGSHAEPPPDGPRITAASGATPTPLDCAGDELELGGAFTECATTVPSSVDDCSTSGHVFDAVLQLSGSVDLLLYIEVNGAYAGPGTYDLPPWPYPLGTRNDRPKVAVQQDGTSAFSQLVHGVSVRQYGTDTFWQSVAGSLVITGRGGRSGTVSAILELSAGHNATLPGTRFSVAGAWSCP